MLTPDQLAFLNRIGIDSASVAIAMQTCGLAEFVRSQVEAYGSMNVYGRHASGKGVIRFGEECDRLWPREKKGKKK